MTSTETTTPTLWRGSMSWHLCCRPDFDHFDSEVTDDERDWLDAHLLEFTDDSTDDDIRDLADTLERVSRSTGSGDVDVERLFALVNETLCPEDCERCAHAERDYLFNVLDAEVTEVVRRHPDVTWVVLDWRHRVVSHDERPDWQKMELRYFASFDQYLDIDIQIHGDDAFAAVWFDGSEFTIHALTDDVDKNLLRHALQTAHDSEEPTSLRELVKEPEPVRALMHELLSTHGATLLPPELQVTRPGKERFDEPTYGCLADAELDVLAAVADPLANLDRTTRDLALDLLPGCEGDWAELVAAVAATA